MQAQTTFHISSFFWFGFFGFFMNHRPAAGVWGRSAPQHFHK